MSVIEAYRITAYKDKSGEGTGCLLVKDAEGTIVEAVEILRTDHYRDVIEKYKRYYGVELVRQINLNWS